MALILCPECNNQISDRADKCPFCGLPNEFFNSTECTSVINEKTSMIVELANTSYSIGNYVDAMNHCDKAIEINPHEYQAWFLKGLIVLQQDLSEQSIAEMYNYFQNAIKYCPDEEKVNIEKKIVAEIQEHQEKTLLESAENYGNTLDDNSANAVLFSLVSFKLINDGFQNGTTIHVKSDEFYMSQLENLHDILENIYQKQILEPGTKITSAEYRFTFWQKSIHIFRILGMYSLFLDDEMFDNYKKYDSRRMKLINSTYEIVQGFKDNFDISPARINALSVDLLQPLANKINSRLEDEYVNKCKNDDIYKNNEIQKLANESNEIREKLSTLNNELNSNKAMLHAKQDSLDSLRKELSSLGLFDHKRKDEVRAEIQIIEQKIAEFNNNFSDRNHELESSISSETTKLATIEEKLDMLNKL